MKASRLSVFTLATVLLTGFVHVATSARRTPPPPPESPTAGEATALALRLASLHEADAEFFARVARLLNDTSANLVLGVGEALADHAETIEIVERQHEARLAAAGMVGDGPYDPIIESGQTSPVVDNPWHPLVPNRTLAYEKKTFEGLERYEVTVLPDPVEVGGVVCLAVRSVETVGGVLVDETTEWFAQHVTGDVWCFGELAMRYDEGFLESLEGSWRAGREGAKAGLRMLRHPEVGVVCRAGFLPGDVEDLIKVVSLGETVVVGGVTHANCVVIEEWSPLEPGERDRKYFAPGVGLVLEVDLVTGERLELAGITNG